MKRIAKWRSHYFGGADVRYGLHAPDGRLLGGVMQKRKGEHWRAYIVTAKGAEPAVMACGRKDAGNGRFWTRGPAKHAVERVVRSNHERAT